MLHTWAQDHAWLCANTRQNNREAVVESKPRLRQKAAYVCHGFDLVFVISYLNETPYKVFSSCGRIRTRWEMSKIFTERESLINDEQKSLLICGTKRFILCVFLVTGSRRCCRTISYHRTWVLGLDSLKFLPNIVYIRSNRTRNVAS